MTVEIERGRQTGGGKSGSAGRREPLAPLVITFEVRGSITNSPNKKGNVHAYLFSSTRRRLYHFLMYKVSVRCDARNGLSTRHFGGWHSSSQPEPDTERLTIHSARSLVWLSLRATTLPSSSSSNRYRPKQGNSARLASEDQSVNEGFKFCRTG